MNYLTIAVHVDAHIATGGDHIAFRRIINTVSIGSEDRSKCLVNPHTISAVPNGRVSIRSNADVVASDDIGIRA